MKTGKDLWCQTHTILLISLGTSQLAIMVIVYMWNYTIYIYGIYSVSVFMESGEDGEVLYLDKRN